MHNFLDLVVFSFSCYALTFAIIESPLIFFKPRLEEHVKSFESPNWFLDKLNYLLECYACSGFWAGIVMSYIFNYETHIKWGFFSSASCLFLSYIFELLVAAHRRIS